MGSYVILWSWDFIWRDWLDDTAFINDRKIKLMDNQEVKVICLQEAMKLGMLLPAPTVEDVVKIAKTLYNFILT